ncbi:hypothetical protein XENOCAPTIV_001260 [Xenoophorus captivus]|uniref:Claudin n=1 Tax=Xenoophorus captivus TaxID=1517983 RepID=A0ABV0QTY6_9TELE
MAHICRQLIGVGGSCAGWVGLIFATATNDWVRTCDYSMATCLRIDELGGHGLWAECRVSPTLYNCEFLDQTFSLPAYVLVSRALMISACLLGVPAILLVLMSMPCVRLPTNYSATIKKRRTQAGGILFIIMGEEAFRHTQHPNTSVTVMGCTHLFSRTNHVHGDLQKKSHIMNFSLMLKQQSSIFKNPPKNL